MADEDIKLELRKFLKILNEIKIGAFYGIT